mmetsp:Transcript_48122/g.94991  ORF Transcript_48122/g.94991 Transcript_48122/m.94991 type:complete len:123 (+) Transcript_48122:516-884(+)
MPVNPFNLWKGKEGKERSHHCICILSENAHAAFLSLALWKPLATTVTSTCMWVFTGPLYSAQRQRTDNQDFLEGWTNGQATTENHRQRADLNKETKKPSTSFPPSCPEFIQPQRYFQFSCST